MALIFPTPAQAALQTPVNTFSPTSTPLANTANTSTYTYDTVRGVWLTSGGGGAGSNAMPCSGGIFSGPVQFDSQSLFCETASFCCDTTFACTATFDDTVICGTALHCGDTITCGDQYVYGTTYNCGNVVNSGTVTNCALVENCADVCNYGTTYNIGAVVNCALVENCADVCNYGTTYNIGNTVNCGNSLFCGDVEICGNTISHGTALFCGAVVNESTVTNCALVENCGNTVTHGTALFCGTTVNEGVVVNCALVQNCADVCNYGTVYNIGDTVTCGNSLICGNIDICGITTNHGDVYNCGTTYNVGDVVTCGNALFCGNMETCGNVVNNGTVTNEGAVVNCGATTFCGTTTFENNTTFCNPVTFCTTPILPPGVNIGCALCVTYDNATSGLAATNVQAAIDEVALLPPIATNAVLGKVCIGTNIAISVAGEISVADATTANTGVVQLYDATNSSATNLALTAAQGKNLQDQIDALTFSNNVTLAGTYDGATGQMVTVTTAGTAAGFVIGNALPAAAAGNQDYYVLVTNSGGGAGVGDWYLSDGATWNLIPLGATTSNASTTTAGVVELATNAETQTGTDATRAVTPASLQSKVSDSTSTTSSTTVASSTAVKAAYDLAAAAIPDTAITAKGDLIAGTGAGTYTDLSVGANGQLLAADSAAPTGLRWVNANLGTVTGISTTLPLSVNNANPAIPVLSVALATTATTGVVSVGTNVSVSAAGAISVADASTASKGVVQLYNGTDSPSLTLALTAAQGKNLQDQIDALSFASSVTLAGTYNGATGLVDTVTTAGTAAGFVVGAGLPAAAPGNNDYYVLVTNNGGGAIKGDWYLSDGTTWNLIPLGFTAPLATTSVAGIVELSTNAQAQVGTDSTTAVTPSALQSKLSDSVSTTSSTAIASSTAVKTAYDLAAAAIPCACITTLGDILISDGANPTALPVGTDGQILIADSTDPLGLKWISQSPAGVASVTGVSPVVVNNADPANPVISAPVIPDATFTALGELIVGTGAGTYVALTPGTDTFVLSADSTAPSGLKWVAAGTGAGTVTNIATGTGLTGGPITTTGTISLANTTVAAGSYTYTSFTVDAQGRLTAASSGATPVLPADFTAKGDILAADAAGSFVALGVGTDGQILIADSTAASGLKWISQSPAGVASVTGTSPIVVNNGDPANPVVGIDAASTTQSGAVQLNDTVTSTSTTEAATANAVKTAYDLAADAVPDATFTAKGDLLAGTGAGTYSALALGTDGFGLVADSAQAEGVKWAALCQGTLTGVTVNAPLTVDNTNPAVPDLDIDVATTVATGVVSVGTNISVDAAGEISVADGDTTGKGVVQLYDNTNSNSTTLALTANQGLNLQTQIDNLALAGGLILAGTYDASANQMITVTSNGTAAGFTVGSDYPAAAPANTDYFVIVTVAGGGATNGDWYLSDGTTWNLVDVGFQAPAATTTQQGIVELATNAQTQAGTDTTTAVTPASLQSKVSSSIALNSSTSIASSSAVKTAYDLAAAAIPCADFLAKGDVLVGTAAGTYVALGTGANGEVLTVDTTAASGLKWAAPASSGVTNIATGTGLTGGPITTTGTIALANTAVSAGSYTYASITVDAQGRLTAASNGTSPVTSITAGTGLTGGTITSTGTINLANTAVASGSYTYASFTVDAQGRLTAASNGATPVCVNDFNAKGNLLVGTANNAFTALSVGTNGQVLVADSAEASGVKWVTQSASGVQSVTGTSPITVGGTAANPVVAINAGTTAQPGAVQLCSATNSTSTTTAATPSAVKAAYDLANAAIPCSTITAKGDLVVGTSASTPVALPVGTNGFVLAANSACASGLEWVTTPPGADATRSLSGSLPGCAPNDSRQNTMVGYAQLYNTTGQRNTALGYNAGIGITTGNGNTFLGWAAGGNNGGSNNVAIGCCSYLGPAACDVVNIGANTKACCSRTVLIGSCAGGNVSYSDVVAVGYCAGWSSPGSAVAIGAYAGRTMKGFDTVVGYCAMTAKSGNTFGTTVIGACAGTNITTGGENVTLLGFNAQPSVGSASNQITLGNATVTTLRAAVTTITALSDARDKTDITALPVGLDFVNALNPVKFTWQQREPNEVKDGTSEAGFIAQELQEVQEQFEVSDYMGLVLDDNPDKLEASPGKLIPVLVKAIQELSAQVTELKAEVETLKNQ